MTKALRTGKVFVDWSQNNPAKTTVAPYSLRARDEPTVSTPLTWDEVEAGGTPRFTSERGAGAGRASTATCSPARSRTATARRITPRMATRG